MPQYDSVIRIVTKITTKDAEESLASLEWKIKKSAKYMNELRSKMDLLKDQKIPTKEYKDLQSNLEDAKKELSGLIAEQERYDSLGINSGGAWDSLNEKIATASDNVDSIKAKMQAHTDAGKDFVLGKDTEQYATWGRQYEYEEETINKAGEHYTRLLEKTNEKQAKTKAEAAEEQRLAQIRENAVVGNQRIVQTLEHIKQLEQEIADLKKAGVTEGYEDYDGRLRELSVLKTEVNNYTANIEKNKDSYNKLGNTTKQSFEKVNKSAKKSGGIIATLASRFKELDLSHLIFNQISKAFNAMASGIKEGFGNLYKENQMFKNSIDSLKASTNTLKNALAAAFKPLVDIAIPYVQKAIDYLTILADKFAQILAAITGQKTYTKAIKQTTGALKDQNKENNKQLSSLDKLNNLSSGGKGEGASGTGSMFEEVPVDQNLAIIFQQMAEYAEKLKNIFSQGFWDGLGDWEYRWDAVKESIGTIKNSLVDIWTDPSVLSASDSYNESIMYMLGSLAGSATSIGISIASNLLGGISKYLSENGSRIKEFIVSMFDIGTEINYLISDLSETFAYIFEAFAGENGQQLTSNIIGIFADAFMGVAEIVGKLIRDILTIFIQPFVDNKEEFRTALDGFLGVLSEVTGTIKEGIDETFEKLNEVYDEHFKPFFDSIANGLSDTVGKFMEFWNGSVQPILDEWAAKFDQVWIEHIQPMLNKFVKLFGKVADFLKVVWENVLKPLIDWIIENVLPVVLPIIDGIVKGVMTLFGVISDVISGIIDVLGGVMDFLTGVFSGDWDKAWRGIVDIFKGIFNLIPTIIEGIINTAIDIINGIIGGINVVATKVPGVPTIPEIEKVSIPRLATGTVVPPNDEFMAVLGDNKREPEIVSPVSTMKQAVFDAILAAGGIGTQGGETNLHLTVECEGHQLISLIQKLDREYYKQAQRHILA